MCLWKCCNLSVLGFYVCLFLKIFNIDANQWLKKNKDHKGWNLLQILPTQTMNVELSMTVHSFRSQTDESFQ